MLTLLAYAIQNVDLPVQSGGETLIFLDTQEHSESRGGALTKGNGSCVSPGPGDDNMS